MSVVWAILRREIQSYFVSPIAYAVIVGFLAVSGFFMSDAVRAYSTRPPEHFLLYEVTVQSAVISRIATWQSMAVLMSLPLLAMRLFSEERKSGTIELLLTSPLTTPQLVAGKYLGALAVYTLMLALSTPYLVFLQERVVLDWGAVLATYAGLWLLGAVVLAVGLFASALTENQIVAAVLTYPLVVPFLFVDLFIPFVSTETADWLGAFSLGEAFRAFSRGAVDSHGFVLHAALAFLFLFLAAQVLDSTRWR